MKIRPYEAADRDALVRLWKACKLIAPRNDPDRDIARKLLASPDWFVVGMERSALIGSIMIGYDGHRGWINYLAVAPEYRRKGLATQLMRHAEKTLRNAGCPKINLQIRSENEAVQFFYANLGYRLDPVVSMGKRLIADERTPLGNHDR